MSNFSHLWNQPAVKAACAKLASSVDQTAQDAITIQQIAAPTFAEHERARFMYDRFRALPLVDVEMDEAGNVYGRLPGREAGPGLLVSAHLDTVFPAETDLTIRREPGRIYGPGISDNSMGTAALLRLATVLCNPGDIFPCSSTPVSTDSTSIPWSKGHPRVHSLHFPMDLNPGVVPRRDIWFVANVCEEGLGNLKGMWMVMRRLVSLVGAVVVLEGGAYGSVIHRGIGAHRRRLTVVTEGGHSWSDFGTPSAIHELCRFGAALAALKVPKKPRTSYNLGMIEGGTSINTIAAQATALLDLRSEEPKELQKLATKVDRLLAQVRRKGVEVRSEVIGERPAGAIAVSHPLARAAMESMKWVGHKSPKLRTASTDANLPLSLGIPTVCIGVSVGHNAHRLNEYVELAPLKEGLQHCYLTILASLELF